jgi:hypothetical protein
MLAISVHVKQANGPVGQLIDLGWIALGNGGEHAAYREGKVAFLTTFSWDNSFKNGLANVRRTFLPHVMKHLPFKTCSLVCIAFNLAQWLREETRVVCCFFTYFTL